MAIMGSCSPNKLSKERLFDPVRKAWVAATPEERVRQQLLHHMLHTLEFPKELIAVEKELDTLPHVQGSLPLLMRRRADIIAFAKDIHPNHALYPLLLVECKQDLLDSRAVDQLLGYNHYVQAPFIALVNETKTKTGYFDKQKGAYHFISYLPSFKELISYVRA